MNFDEIRNETTLKLNDISSEKWREYRFSDHTVSIQNPLGLNVSGSGGHRVIDAQGISHYVPTGWRELAWEAKDGEPHLVK